MDFSSLSLVLMVVENGMSDLCIGDNPTRCQCTGNGFVKVLQTLKWLIIFKGHSFVILASEILDLEDLHGAISNQLKAKVASYHPIPLA